MNKILALLIVLVVIYQSFSSLVDIFVKKRARRKEYKLSSSKKFSHLFWATLLLLIPLLCVVNYYQLLPFIGRIILLVLTALCGLCALISFYVYTNHLKKTPYESLIYDPKQLTIELFKDNSRELITLNRVSRVEWYSIKNALKIMPWSSFEYLAFELRNGNKVIIPSLIITPAQLHTFLLELDVVRIKKLIPAIN